MLTSRSSSNSNRKPLGDLTNKLSTTSLDDRESTSSKVSVIKAQISEESKKKKDPVDVMTVVAVKTPDVSARQVSSSVEVGKRSREEPSPG